VFSAVSSRVGLYFPVFLYIAGVIFLQQPPDWFSTTLNAEIPVSVCQSSNAKAGPVVDFCQLAPLTVTNLMKTELMFSGQNHVGVPKSRNLVKMF